MKIKSVCEITGLTDRAIRHYIEQKLIFPSYTENYLGRRAYDFSEADINILNSIAVLRKFDFTLDEIRSVIENAETSKEILLSVKERIAQTVSNGQNKLSALSQINADRSYTIAELAEELSKVSRDLPVHNETIKTNIVKLVLSILKAMLIFLIVWMPIALSLINVIFSINEYHYPVFEPKLIALTLASYLPSIIILIKSKTGSKCKKVSKLILLTFCVLSIPVSLVLSCGIVSKSETTDFRNYRDFDADCIANKNVVFRELFPNQAHYFEHVWQSDGTLTEVYLDAHYYYRYLQGFDYTYDVYAEWPLHKEEYAKEIKRASAIFSKAVEDKTYGYTFAQQKKGDYNCLILYHGNQPFSPVTDSYDYIIFAYNDNTNTVRYICCDSLENGIDQPFYLQLEW